MVILISSIIVLSQINSSWAATAATRNQDGLLVHTKSVSTKGKGSSSTNEHSSKGGATITGTVKTHADPVAIKLHNKGNDKLELGHAEEAMEYFNEALDIEPGNKVILNSKGVAFKQLHNYEKAIEYYDKALAINPNFDSALYNKAVSLSILGRCKEAIEYYNRALDENPNDAGALKGKKITLEKINNNTCSSTYSSTTHQTTTTSSPVTTPPITPAITKNNPPLANDKSVTTNMSTPIDIILPASDPDHDKLTTTITATPLNGKLSDIDQQNGKVTYTPRAGFTSSDSFMFKVNDGKIDSNTALVTIVINPEQQQQQQVPTTTPTDTTSPSSSPSLPSTTTTTPTTTPSIADELTKLVNLRNQGILSEEEFNRLKNDLIKNVGTGGSISTGGGNGVVDGSMGGSTVTTVRTGANTTDYGSTTASDDVSGVGTDHCNGIGESSTDRAESGSGNGNTTSKAMNECNPPSGGTTTTNVGGGTTRSGGSTNPIPTTTTINAGTGGNTTDDGTTASDGINGAGRTNCNGTPNSNTDGREYSTDNERKFAAGAIADGGSDNCICPPGYRKQADGCVPITCTDDEMKIVEKVKEQLKRVFELARGAKASHFISGLTKWLDGNDTPLSLDVNWLRSTRYIKNAERNTEMHFMIINGKDKKSILSAFDEVILKKLPYGKTEPDHWEYANSAPLPLVKLDDAPTVDFALTLGSFQLHSEGQFEISRVNNGLIHIKGTVKHSLHDDFDFNPGKQFPPEELSWLTTKFHIPIIINDDLNLLKKCDKAKDYHQSAEWSRTVDITDNAYVLREKIRSLLLPFKGP